MAELQKGDILYGNLRDWDYAYHPIVYWEGDLNTRFTGVMLTHSGKFPDNIPFLEEHFLTHDEHGAEFDFKFDNTHFVAVQLIKPSEWGPYTKNGQLTQEGIEFVEAVLPQMTPVLWDHYIQRRRP